MNKTIDEKGKEGDEPKIKEVDEEKEKGELTKKTKKVKEVSHELENKVVDMVRCVQRQMPGVRVQKTAKVPQLHLTRWSMSLLAQFIDGLNVPVIMQRRGVLHTVKEPQIQFIARV